MKQRARLVKMEFDNLGIENKVVPMYRLKTEAGLLNMNERIGHPLAIHYLNKITCSACGKVTKRSFGQGYCYPCFITVPQTEECVLRPELCRAHDGFARDLDFAKGHCLVNHMVYLALSGGLKVGVTRQHQGPTRWVDQGAARAVQLVVTPNRYWAGMVEVELKKQFNDKTNWRKMLMGAESAADLGEMKSLALNALKGKGMKFELTSNPEYEITYPIASYPQAIHSVSFEKVNSAAGRLIGIKGQYLIFENGSVLNIRTHSGYYVELEF